MLQCTNVSTNPLGHTAQGDWQECISPVPLTASLWLGAAWFLTRWTAKGGKSGDYLMHRICDRRLRNLASGPFVILHLSEPGWESCKWSHMLVPALDTLQDYLPWGNVDFKTFMPSSAGNWNKALARLKVIHIVHCSRTVWSHDFRIVYISVIQAMNMEVFHWPMQRLTSQMCEQHRTT